MQGFEKRTILRNAAGAVERREDPIAIEKRLRISVNGKELLSLYCTPLMIRELVVGMLMTEDIIRGGWCAERMTIIYNDDVIVDVPAEGEASTEGAVIT